MIKLLPCLIILIMSYHIKIFIGHKIIINKQIKAHKRDIYYASMPLSCLSLNLVYVLYFCLSLGIS